MEPRAKTDRFGGDAAILADHVDDAFVLVGSDCLVRDENRSIGIRAFDFHTPEQAGLQDEFGVRKAGAHPHRAGLVVDPVLGEIELAFERRLVGVGDRDEHRDGAGPFLQRAAAFPRRPRIGKQPALVDIEIEIDRIERDDRRQYRLVRLDEIARGDEPPVDAAAQRRGDGGVIEIEPGPLNRRLGAAYIRLCREQRPAVVVEPDTESVPVPASDSVRLNVVSAKTSVDRAASSEASAWEERCGTAAGR